MAAYLRLLIRDRLAAFRFGSKKESGKSNKLLSVLKVVGIVLAVLLLYGSVAFMEYMLFSLLHGMRQGELALSVALLGCTLVTLIYGFFHVNGKLFFSRDTSFLASLPLSSHTVLTGKIVMTAIGEACVALAFAAPLVISYGVVNRMSVLFYLKSFIVYALVPLVPLAVAMVLSFLLIRVSSLWKRREGMTTIISFAFFILIMVGEISLQNIEDEQISQWLLTILVGQRSVTQLLLRNLPWLGWAHNGIITNGLAGLGQLVLYAALSVGVIALCILLLGGGYMKLAIRQEESIRRANSTKKRLFKNNADVRSPGVALFWQEVKDVLTVPVYATNCLIGMAALPITVAMIIAMMAKEGDLGELTAFVDMIPKDIFIVCATGVMGLVGAMCEAASTAVSREGTRHEMRKTYPISGGQHLRAKVYMGLFFHMIGVAVICIMLMIVLPAFWMQTLLAGVCAVAPALLLSLFSVIMDAYRPRLNWKTETEAVKQNTNALICMLLSLVAVALLVGAFVLCLQIGLGWILSFVIVMALCIGMDALLFLWLNRGAAKAYFAH